MSDLISRKAAIDAVGRYLKKDGDVITIADVVDAAVAIGMLPSAEPNEQIKWERDTAIQQLADLGYGLGEKPRGDDCISRAAAIDELDKGLWGVEWDKALAEAMIKSVPSAHPTLHGYNIEHLELIARVLQKEDLPPERVVEALTDIDRIVAIVRDEFEETLRRAARNIERRTDG